MGSSIANLCGGSREMRVILLGLDSAGKTTTLYSLKTGKHTETLPTIGFNVERIPYNNQTLTVWDVSGQDRLRSLWRQYYTGTNGIIFVVDSNDKDRFKLAKHELHYLMKEQELKFAVMVILANKQDLPKAVKPEELKKILELDKVTMKHNIFGTVASKPSHEGLKKAVNWLTQNMKPI